MKLNSEQMLNELGQPILHKAPCYVPLRVLNLYAGIGGNRKFWEGVEVTAVEYNEEICEYL